MNVVEIQDTSIENMFVTMSSIGNLYVNTVIFQLQYLYPNLFVNEEEIFYLLGGVGFSYRCRRSKRKGTRIYTQPHQLNFRQMFALLHQAESKDSFRKRSPQEQNKKASDFPPKIANIEESHHKQIENHKQIEHDQPLFHYVPKTLLEFRNAICEGLTNDRDIIFATWQHHPGSSIDNSEFDPFDLVSVQEDIMIDISNEILLYSKELSNISERSSCNKQFREEHYGQIRLFRLVEYNCVLVRVWDAKNQSLHSFSFREFWKMFDKIEVFTVPQNICRRAMYAYAFLSIYESQTRAGGNLEGFIELQNALRRKSIRNSWWTLFCEDISRSQNKSDKNKSDETYTSNKSKTSYFNDPTNEFPSHIDKVISQLYVQLVLTTNGGYRKDMSRICQALAEQSCIEENLQSTTSKPYDIRTIELEDIRVRQSKEQKKELIESPLQDKRIQERLQEIASLYASSSKKISFLGELLLSIHTPESYRIRTGIDVFVNNCRKNNYSPDAYPKDHSIGTNQFEQSYHFQLERNVGDQKENVDWQSYFDLMDDTISRILELESRVARKTLEMSNLLFGEKHSQNIHQNEEVA